MKTSSQLLFGFIIICLTSVWSYQVYADEDIDQEFFRSVSSDLRCPTCTGLSILDSNASFSEQIKEQVRQQIRAGKSKQEILDFFVERYGLWILREPPKEGFNLLAWLLPTGILIFGPVLIWFFVWRKRKIIDSYGVRSVDAIVKEMNDQIKALRGGESI